MTPASDPTASPADLGAAMRRTLQAARVTLVRQMVTRPVPIQPPAACPDELATRLDLYNTDLARLEDQQAAHVEAVAAVPLLMADGSVAAAAIAAEAARLKAARYDLAQRELDLLEARQPLLRDVADHLASTLTPEAEAAVAKAQDKADKALRKAGRAPEDRPSYQLNKGAAQDQFNYEVATSGPVREAVAAVEALRVEIRTLRSQASATGKDTLVLGQEVRAAFHAITGVLV